MLMQHREAYLRRATGRSGPAACKRSREKDNYVSKDYTLKSTGGDGGTRSDHRQSAPLDQSQQKILAEVFTE